MRTDDPAAAILEVAETVNADVIVLGGHATDHTDLGETIRTFAPPASASVYLVRV